MLDRIRAAIPALPPAEQRVAKLVLADPRSFASLPVGTLAERSQVSTRIYVDVGVELDEGDRQTATF